MFFSRRPPSPTELSDAELLARYRQHGAVADLGVLYERHMPVVFAICRKYLRPDEDAQDAVMQLFEKLIDTLRRHEVAHFPAWLHATARNHCLMMLRSRQRAGPESGPVLVQFPDAAGVESVGAAHLTDDAEEQELTEARLQALEHALAGLPAAQRRCLELFYLEKKCYRDIAHETGFDLSLVKSHLQNGKRNLRHALTSPPNHTSSANAAR
ncbi:RNA polymerase sigma-70 factor, ECF subfamily [Hymenobacter daecheongensis DSM 21074]|uniref:RNA polymerase sigma-70 factor, ECF subfamily n=1 Tax=Hymenobacter daecheongensis DSM 21074 TaxID=1121955 RepID=A0A1M6AYG1_9BACT|nr:sigma-70 family RNA polymerase sigma factor [Hymenobacter daecheongensis]SHI41496.1 RNA polymerase sigma-70 factor, ECF subfamily [Hymenobacter daecheongensis DSM 21074]